MGEVWSSILISLLASALYDLGKAGKSWIQKLFWRKETFRKEDLVNVLQLKLDAFLSEREEILFLDSDWFINFLKYQKPMEKLCRYVADYSKLPNVSQEEFLSQLISDTEEAALWGGRPLSFYQQSVVKELYQMLMNEVEDILFRQIPITDRFQLMQIRNRFQQELKPIQNEVSMLRHKQESERFQFAELVYHYPKPYLKRYCYSQDNQVKPKDERKETCRLAELCQRYSCVIVLGEAGNGKTTELYWTAAYYSERKELPRPVVLTLKTYMDETLEELAVKQGCWIENENRLFFIIDGFDETAGGNRQNFLKRLTAYRQQNPEARFLISARNHFYHEGILGDSFKTVWIEPLELADAAAFAEEVGADKDGFIHEIYSRNLTELVLVPFYLVEICKIYKEKGALPERGQLMKELIDHKCFEDLKKFQLTASVDLHEEQVQIRLLLQKIGAAIYAMDCRTLSEEEYRSLIPLPEDRELLKYSGVWTFQQGAWQFSHNNFGEYLAAEYLLKCPLETIKVLVSAGYPELGICSHWHHVLSYLLSISNGPIEEWLLEQDFTLFFNWEANRIPAARRSGILRKEWERLKKQHEWITAQRYRAADLMKFGAGYLEIMMFLEEMNEPEDMISLQNAILALSSSPDLFGLEESVRNTFIDVLNTCQDFNSIYEYGILGLLKLGLMGEEELAQLIGHFWDTDSSEIRYSLYSCIRVLDQADPYIEFLTDGLQYVSPGIHANPGRLGNESFELHYAFMTVKTPSAAVKILEVISKDARCLFVYQMDQVVERIFSVLAEAGNKVRPPYWETLKEFYKVVSYTGHHSMEKAALDYFTISGFKKDFFLEELELVIERKHSWRILWKLMDDEISVWAAEQYKNGLINEIQAKCCIDCMKKENPGYAWLAADYEKRTGSKIPDKPVIDYESYRIQGMERYQRAILCKEDYLHLIDEMIGLYGKETLTEEDMDQALLLIPEEQWELKEVSFDYRRTQSVKSVQEWKHGLNEEWEEFQGYLMMQWLQRNELEKGEISEKITAAATRYYYQYIKSEDFSKAACWKTDTAYQLNSTRAKKLLYFAWRFEFPMEKKQAEGIFTAAALMDSEKNCQELLERYFTNDEIRSIVLTNMKKKRLKGDDLHLHLSYCIKLEISQCAEEIRKVAADSGRSEWIQKRALDYFIEVIGPDAVSQVILPELADGLFLYGVSQIIEKKPKGLADHLWNHARQNPSHQMICYRDLIQLQDIRGLRAYRMYLEQERSVKKNTADSLPLDSIPSVRNEDLWEEVFQMTRLWLEPDFEDQEFGGLAFALGHGLSGIAGSGEKGYQEVKRILEDSIQSKQDDFLKKVRLCRWLDDAKRSYQQNIQRKWPLEKTKEYIFLSSMVFAHC